MTKEWQLRQMCFTVALLNLADIPELGADANSHEEQSASKNRTEVSPIGSISARDCSRLWDLRLPAPLPSHHIIHR